MEDICFYVIADSHIQFPFSLAKRNRQFHQAIDHLLMTPDMDALILLGDISDHGFFFQQRFVLQEVKRLVDEKKAVHILLGNHDIYHPYASDESIFHLQNDVHAFLSLPLQKEVYEEIWIRQTPFLLLESERRLKTDAFFSTAQIDWLKQKLTKYEHLPYVFVLNHQPLSNTHPISEQLGLGEQDPIIKELLSKYSNVIWLSAHLHTCASDCQPMIQDQTILLDTPSFAKPQRKAAPCGCGLRILIQKGILTYQVWDFLNDTVLTEWNIRHKKIRQAGV